MSEPSITVSQEVQAILAVQAANYQNSASVLEEDAAKFYLDVAAELRWILDDARKRANAEPAGTAAQPAAPFPVGSKVLLTGKGWDGLYDLVPSTGDVVEITRIDGGLSLFEWDDSAEWSVEGDEGEYWGGRLVDPEIRVGDTVRITEAYAEEVSFDSGQNRPGVEFQVTAVKPVGSGKFYVTGDPQDWGIWNHFIEKVYE